MKASSKTSASADSAGFDDLRRRFEALDVDFSHGVLHVSLQRQQLCQIGPSAQRCYPVSTSRYGEGCADGSLRTPTGLHRVEARIGAGAATGTVFVARQPAVPVAGGEGDHITSRILWLRGLQPGVNSGDGVDTYARFIYIHGTPHAAALGSAASQGCIRMGDRDVIELFDAVVEGTPVLIGN